MNRDVVLTLAQALEENKSVAHLIIVDQKGSSPRRSAEMVVDEKGNVLAGTIGGGGVELKAIEDAMAAIKQGKNRVVQYKLKVDEEDPEALQMACGGDVTVLIKPYTQSRRIITVGAGHISLALSQLAKFLGYSYIVVDDRPDYANAERFPDAEQIICGDVTTELKQLETTGNDAFVIVSHDHTHDMDALIELKDKPHFYLGMIGSKNKVFDTYQTMTGNQISVDPSQIFAPIGIDIGGEDPEEIALSIVAQIQATWHGKDFKSAKHQELVDLFDLF